MVNLPRIKKRYEVEIEKYNKFFGATEQIKRFELMDREWTVDSGELTASLKLRRRFICEKYNHLTRKIFELEKNQ